jgi:hypothetical protein
VLAATIKSQKFPGLFFVRAGGEIGNYAKTPTSPEAGVRYSAKQQRRSLADHPPPSRRMAGKAP